MRKILSIITALLIICLAACASAEPAPEAAEELAEHTYKVAGVTYYNEDERGRWRQYIIADLMEEYGEWGDIPGELVEYTFEDRPAVYVMAAGECIGNIPAANTAEVIALLPSVEEVIVRTSVFTPRTQEEPIYYARVTLRYREDTEAASD